MIASGLFDVLAHFQAPEATDEQLLRVHSAQHVENIIAISPRDGLVYVDPDTPMGPNSLLAARRAAGAVVKAVDVVLGGEMDTAFCGVRPPGHHAERDRAMGFCLFNNVAVGAAHALEHHALERVAVVDFDVHQGNGTEEIFQDERRVIFCSTFQHPFYPFSELRENTANRINVPLAANAGGPEFRAAVDEHWMPALEAFDPQLVFVSAGFDAHRDDDMSGVSLLDPDYRWVSERIMAIAERCALGRVVSALEGGYEYNSLARCAETHVRVLMGL
jgi:acetoin utilization deacetylase AcuC-like enzyme